MRGCDRPDARLQKRSFWEAPINECRFVAVKGHHLRNEKFPLEAGGSLPPPRLVNQSGRSGHHSANSPVVLCPFDFPLVIPWTLARPFP